MPETTRRRRRTAHRRGWLAAAACAAACAAPATAGAYQPSDLPDLIPMFPTIVSQYQQAPEYVDPLEKPGRLLYRFDGVIWNRAGAGALDTYRDPATGHAYQVIWSGGVPTSPSAPDALPPATDHNWTAVDRTAAVNADFYLQGGSWHFASAALYSLLVPGGPPRISDKVGFCFFDTWGGGATSYFSTDNVNPYGSSWCHQAENGTQVVRMGVSPGLGDYYWSQLKYQWVDVTDLAPGPYTLRGQVNPGNLVLESDTSNNRLDTVRTIPGPTADSAGDQVTGASAAIDLSGTIVGPGVPARVSDAGPCASDIAPTVALAQCYAVTTAGGPLTFQVLRGPAHGTVRIQQAGAQHATATYTPDAGFSGADSFTYRTTDARGLESQPGTISLDVVGGGPQQGGGGTTAPKVRVSLRTIGAVQVGRIVRLRVTLSKPVRLRATLQVLRGRRFRPLMRSVVSRAHPVVAFRPRARGRYVLRLRYTYAGHVQYSPTLTITLRG